MVCNVLNKYKNQTYDLWKKMANMNIMESDKEVVVKGFEAYEIEDQHSANAHRNEQIKRFGLHIIKGDYRSVPQENSTVWGLYNQMNYTIRYIVRTSNILEYAKLNNRLEKYLVNAFSIN
jgi:hypothetical protein